jgi:hypothetical protein
MEDLPHPCYTADDAGNYAKRHDPFVYYTDVAGNARRCDHVVPLTALAPDLRNGRLPTFTWVTPNVCNDMHDCSVATGDRFLHQLVPPLLAGLGRHGLLALVWDEGSSNNRCCRLAAGGTVPFVLAGRDVRHGIYARPADHYSLLRLIEDKLALPRLRNAACPCTPSLNGMLIRVSGVRAR